MYIKLWHVNYKIFVFVFVFYFFLQDLFLFLDFFGNSVAKRKRNIMASFTLGDSEFADGVVAVYSVDPLAKAVHSARNQ